ncbi:MAG: fluoride efflux transporter CrcB [Micrococcales bacterium]|nr:fluoride efflux transporter CrcB [Micrococcales bacterium]
MTPLLFLGIAVAGGIGAVTRFALDGVIRSRTRSRHPLGTLVINISGSLLLGAVTGLALAGLLPDSARLILGTGFLGGYTTFSTASLETVRLLQERRRVGALLHGPGMLVASVLAASLGLWLGGLA